MKWGRAFRILVLSVGAGKRQKPESPRKEGFCEAGRRKEGGTAVKHDCVVILVWLGFSS